MSQHAEAQADTAALNRYLQHLLDTEPIEDPGRGIIRQVIGQGEESLSVNQDVVYDKLVRKGYMNVRCERCGELMEPDDLLWRYENGKLCLQCAARRAKLMKDD